MSVLSNEDIAQTALGTLPKWRVDVKIKYARRRRGLGRRRRRYQQPPAPMYFPTAWSLYTCNESWVHVKALSEKSARANAVKKVKESKPRVRVRTMGAKRV